MLIFKKKLFFSHLLALVLMGGMGSLMGAGSGLSIAEMRQFLASYGNDTSGTPDADIPAFYAVMTSEDVPAPRPAPVAPVRPARAPFAPPADLFAGAGRAAGEGGGGFGGGPAADPRGDDDFTITALGNTGTGVACYANTVVHLFLNNPHIQAHCDELERTGRRGLNRLAIAFLNLRQEYNRLRAPVTGEIPVINSRHPVMQAFINAVDPEAIAGGFAEQKEAAELFDTLQKALYQDEPKIEAFDIMPAFGEEVLYGNPISLDAVVRELIPPTRRDPLPATLVFKIGRAGEDEKNLFGTQLKNELTINRQQYRITGIATHVGNSTRHGHYKTFLYNAGCWYSANDMYYGSDRDGNPDIPTTRTGTTTLNPRADATATFANQGIRNDESDTVRDALLRGSRILVEPGRDGKNGRGQTIRIEPNYSDVAIFIYSRIDAAPVERPAAVAAGAGAGAGVGAGGGDFYGAVMPAPAATQPSTMMRRTDPVATVAPSTLPVATGAGTGAGVCGALSLHTIVQTSTDAQLIIHTLAGNSDRRLKETDPTNNNTLLHCLAMNPTKFTDGNYKKIITSLVNAGVTRDFITQDNRAGMTALKLSIDSDNDSLQSALRYFLDEYKWEK